MGTAGWLGLIVMSFTGAGGGALATGTLLIGALAGVDITRGRVAAISPGSQGSEFIVGVSPAPCCGVIAVVTTGGFLCQSLMNSSRFLATMRTLSTSDSRSC